MRAFALLAFSIALAAAPACGGKSDSDPSTPSAPAVSSIPLPPRCGEARGMTDPSRITTATPAGNGAACGCEVTGDTDFHPATLVEHPCSDGFACVNWKGDSSTGDTVVAGTCAVPRVANEGEECSQRADPEPACAAGLTCVLDTAAKTPHCIHVGELGEPCRAYFECKSQICGVGHCTTGRIGQPCTNASECVRDDHLDCTNNVCVCAPGASCS